MTTFIDLLDADGVLALDADVCIIGGGTIASALADRLANRRLRVVVLEAGARTTCAGADIDFDPAMASTRYSGAIEGRAFGVGGSSARWGGVLVPHSEWDVRAGADPWAHVVRVVREQFAPVRKLLGLQGAADFRDYPDSALGPLRKAILSEGVDTASADMLPFRSRNLARLLEGAPDELLTVVLNAVVTRWSVSDHRDGARVVSVQAVARSGVSLSVSASKFIVAAGALESARVLLDLDEASGGRALKGRNELGRGLGDHLSLRIADVSATDVRRAAELFGPQFRGAVLKTVRMADEETLRKGMRHFAHFVFPIENPGFQFAKKVLFGLQAGRLPDVSLSEIAGASGGLFALGFNRVVKSKLHVPDDTKVCLQLDLEQERTLANSISLATDGDVYGRRRAVVDWRVTDRDRERVALAAQAFLPKWTRLGDRVPALVAVPPDADGAKLHDAYHPVGVTRMGTDPDAVVDLSLRVRGTSNVHLVSTGVFPTAGSANPTFSALCLACELADRV